MALVIFILLLPLAIVIGAAVMGRVEGRRGVWRFRMSQVLSDTFVPIAAAPLALIGISFVANALPTLLIGATVGPDATSGFFLNGDIGAAALHLSQWLVLGTVADAAMILIAIGTLERSAPGVGSALRRAGRMFPVAIVLRLLWWLGVAAGSVLLLVPGIMLAVAWMVAMPALLAEGTGLFGAFGRSAALTGGARWRIFLIVLVMLLVYWIVGLVAGVTWFALGVGTSVAVQAGAAATATILGLFPPLAQAALYHELRTARGGMDTAALEAVFA